MSLTFYFAPMSTAGITEVVLAELGVPYERVTLDIAKGETRRPEYLAVNPNGRVPCIVHDGTAIWESAAITLYLGETFGVERSLFPPPGARRGEAMKWIVWTSVTLSDAVRRSVHDATGKREITECLKVLDQSLAGRPYLVGDYTLADTHVVAFSEWLRVHADVAPFRNIEGWSERCRARPAFKKRSPATK